MKNKISYTVVVLMAVVLGSCQSDALKGTWQYNGGIYNGRSQEASADFKMQRTYSGGTYESHVIEGDTAPELYNSGVYELRNDSLLITSKFSSQPSQTTDITIPYQYRIEGDKMTTNGVLPNGMVVEEYWKRIEP